MKIKMLIILLLATQALSAQAIIALVFGDKLTTDNLKLGLYFAGQASHLTNTDDKYLAGFAIGAYTDIKLSEKWTISNYLTFKAPKGAREIPLNYQVIENGDYPEEAVIKRKIVYFEIVPLVRYHLTASWSVAAGPQFGIRTLSKDFYIDEREDGSKETVEYPTGDYVSRFDVGVSTDIQYVFMQGSGIHLNLRFTTGFIDIYKDSSSLKAYNQYFHIGVGIPVGGKANNNN